MAFLLPHSAFIHVPKTGGQWVVDALRRAGLPPTPLGPVHTSPDELADRPDFLTRQLVFSFVRHPVSWYRSIYAHRVDEGWDEPMDDPDWFTPSWISFWAEFNAACRAPSFEAFVLRCTQHYPDGLLAQVYGRYLNGCTHVGRYESLAADLTTFLELAGEAFNREALQQAPARNVRGRKPARQQALTLTDAVAARLCEAERQVIARYYGGSSAPIATAWTYQLRGEPS